MTMTKTDTGDWERDDLTYVQQAIQRAIEGGWIHGGGTIKYWASNWRKTTSYPLFWQSLGKSLGDGKSEDGAISVSVMIYRGGLMDSWKARMHRFIDHLAEGKDAESFFESLINVKG